MSSSDQWSDWTDLKQEEIQKIPQEPGVFVIHASMKVLYIGGTAKLRESLFERQKDACISDNARFKFMITDNHVEKSKDLVEDYKKRHDGKMPKCM